MATHQAGGRHLPTEIIGALLAAGGDGVVDGGGVQVGQRLRAGALGGRGGGGLRQVLDPRRGVRAAGA